MGFFMSADIAFWEFESGRFDDGSWGWIVFLGGEGF